MSYAQFKKDHPEWPKLMADLEGRKVKLLRGFTTRGGNSFAPGEVFRIRSSHRGKLVLEGVDRAVACRCIRPIDVELLS